MQEISKLGIKVPASLKVAALIQIYKENKDRQQVNSSSGGEKEIYDSAVAENEFDNITTINGVEAAASQIMRSLTNSSAGKEAETNVRNPGVSYSVTQSPLVPDSVFAVQRNVNTMVNGQQHYDMERVMSTMRQPGVAAKI